MAKKRKSSNRRKPYTRRRARPRGEYNFAPMGRKVSRKRSTSSGSVGISSATSAATATAIFWLLEAGFQYGAKAFGIQTPKSRIVIPAIIALLAYKKKINVPNLLPIAIAQLMNTARQTSPAINSMFTFDGYGARPRTYSETIAAINAGAPGPRSQYSGLLQAPQPKYSGMMQTSMPQYSGGYSQPIGM